MVPAWLRLSLFRARNSGLVAVSGRFFASHCWELEIGEPIATFFARMQVEAKNGMLDTVVSAIAYVVNVGVSFLSDGTWKTAGYSVTQFYAYLAADRGKHA